MGQSVQLLMVSLRPGSERKVGAGDVAWAAGRGQRETRWMERAVLGAPAAPAGRTGVRGGRQTGLGTRAQLRTLAAGRGCSLELAARLRTPLARGVGVPQELHGGAGGVARGRARMGKLSYALSCSHKGLKGVTDWRSVVLPLARFTEDKNTAAAPTSYTDTKIVTDWSTESYNHRVN